MADREKVIRAVDSCFDYWLDKHGYLSQLELERVRQIKADALVLLKEQEAVEPILIREGRNKYYNDYVCPGCDNELSYGQNYCSECGRPVKWK